MRTEQFTNGVLFGNSLEQSQLTETIDASRETEEAGWQPAQGEWTVDTTHPFFIKFYNPKTQEAYYLLGHPLSTQAQA